MNLTQAIAVQSNNALRNRMKQRVHIWWHTNNCPNCAARRALAGGAPSSMADLIESLKARGIEVEDVSNVHVLGVPPKAH